jgi:type IV secretory pathway VirD2 relaxase
MGGNSEYEPSVTGQLARRLAGFKGSSSLSGKARRTGNGRRAAFDRRQRATVKVHVCRHRPGKVHSSVLRHVSYIGRESASLDGRQGVFYDSAREGLDARQAVKDWESDRHHFRLIISAENASDLPDMKLYIRRVMSLVERDLGTPLQWLAVDHHNTDNPHTHVLLRGRKQDGTDLVMPRQYIAQGIRQRASEVATDMLGPRSVDENRRERDRQITAERFTALDRMIERSMEVGGVGQAGRIDLHPHKPIGFAVDDRNRVLGRLQFLQTMDLAKKGKGTWWILDPEFGSRLRDLGRRNDLIKTLYASLGTQAGNVERMNAREASVSPILGELVAKGSVDEITDRKFVVVRDGAGKLYYGQVPADENFRRAQSGSVVELGEMAHRQRTVMREIITVAQGRNGVYTAADHAAFLSQNYPDMTPDQAAAKVRSAAAKLAFIAGHNGSGVTNVAEGQFQIDAPVFERFASARRSQTDMRILSAYGLNQQVEVRAFTWLDRSLLPSGFQPSGTGQRASAHWHGEFAAALERRRQWLVAQGLAEFTGPERHAIAFKAGAVAYLRSAEFRQLQATLANEFKKSSIRLPRETTVTGRYVGLRELYSGPVALISAPQRVYVTNWTRQFNVIQPGNAVTALLDRSGRLTVKPSSQALTLPNLFNQSRELNGELNGNLNGALNGKRDQELER